MDKNLKATQISYTWKVASVTILVHLSASSLLRWIEWQVYVYTVSNITKIPNKQRTFPAGYFRFYYYNLKQGSSNLILEGRCPAEFSSNLPQHICMEVWSIPSKSLISCFRCVWLGLELNSAGHRPSRTELGDPWPKENVPRTFQEHTGNVTCLD